MRRSKRFAAVACLVGSACTSLALAQERDSRPADRQPEEGPVIRTNAPSTSGTSASSSGHRMASDPAGTAAGRSGGGSLVGPHWGGSISDPEKEAEHRIKKLIQRLG